MIKKVDDKWLVDIQPGGRGNKRYRKFFKTKADALFFERSLQAKVIQVPGYELPKKDTRRLNDLLQTWYGLAGVLLSTSKETFARLSNASTAMGNPVVQSIPERFLAYRVQRIESGFKPSTLNRELMAFKSMFSSLIKAGHYKQANPFDSIKSIKDQEPKMAFLTNDQIKALFDRLRHSKSDAYLVALICLSTGARWREAQNLMLSDVKPGLVTYAKTKTRKARSVPITDTLYQQIVAVLSMRRFTDCYSAFSVMLKETGIDLPRGQRTHVLRHTFASHFVMNRGNILTLQKVLGHASLNMTLRYSHLAPDYLSEVLEKNPALTIR